MEKKHQVHNLIILDESGSMASIQETTIQGFNEIVQTIKGIEKEFPDQEHYISLLSFNGLGIKTHHFIDPVEKLTELNTTLYRPDASTPLFDAMGFGLNKLNQELTDQTDYHVLVTIMTDGQENASKEFSGSDIKKLVEEFKMKGWTFTYIGTDHEVDKFAKSVSISNHMVFSKNEDDMKEMFEKEKSARKMFSAKIERNENKEYGFYDDEEF
ncbi:MAG: vWA domain-containing protein [Saprospiraceae bacterium]